MKKGSLLPIVPVALLVGGLSSTAQDAGNPSKGVRGVANRILIRMAGMGPYLTCLER